MGSKTHTLAFLLWVQAVGLMLLPLNKQAPIGEEHALPNDAVFSGLLCAFSSCSNWEQG